MRPLILADWVKAEGITQLLHIQLYDRRGELQTSSVLPCADPVLAIQLAVEVVEFAEIGGGFDLQTSDREIFRHALADPEINAEILHPSDMAHLNRTVTDSTELYRELYPAEVVEVREEAKGWRVWVVRWLYKLIKYIEKGDKQNEKIREA